MNLNYSLKTVVISLFSLALLPIENPVIARENQVKSTNYQINSKLNITQILNRKQPIQIARDDYYWGPQRDFRIWMPGVVTDNTSKSLITTNETNKTIYIIVHEDLPQGANYWTQEETRQILQTAMRENLDTQGKVIKSTNMVVEGYPGIELLIQHSDGSQGQYQGYVVRRRLYLIGARSYDELTTEATYFFDSFRVYPSRIVNYR
ncbi:hypothetical protein H6F32_12975 [Anabaena sp. FACHB-1237]|uniref:hypothetical protein n=1 Tax=Anabaena sp. FACHB-1237 TaxID=2692769 RepID=UPI001680E67C|nr:hypothetical protein [Anabaena sp. FACHB-1237]MBD2138482.1 hypothetical protein [Anabaena sp. FACHB-1237]